MSVIVTNAKNRIAYAAIRSLARKGIKVISADYYPWSMSFFSDIVQGILYILRRIYIHGSLLIN